MSYLVLARKWRPQTFADLVGQEHVAQTLKNAIAQGRIAHAFLFTGARGVGKTTIARVLAKALNCMSAQGPSPEPCGQCSACTEIARGNDVDVKEIDGASNNSVDDVRRLQETLPYLPVRDRFKVVIIDEVHMLSTGAFNALLKTLEEPPPHVKFVFATTEVHKVPITILSRCQRYDFKLIPTQKIRERIEHILQHEQIEHDDAAVTLVAREAAGSMRDALSLLDQVIAGAAGTLTGTDAARLLGVADRRVLYDLARAVLAGEAANGLGHLQSIAREGYDLPTVARDFLALLRDLVVARVVPDPAELLDLPDEERLDVLAIAQSAEVAELERLFVAWSRTVDEVARAREPRWVLEMAVVRLAHRPALVPIDELIGRLAELEKRLGGGDPRPPTPAGGGGGGGARTARPAVHPGPQGAPRHQPGPASVGTVLASGSGPSDSPRASHGAAPAVDVMPMATHSAAAPALTPAPPVPTATPVPPVPVATPSKPVGPAAPAWLARVQARAAEPQAASAAPSTASTPSTPPPARPASAMGERVDTSSAEASLEPWERVLTAMENGPIAILKSAVPLEVNATQVRIAYETGSFYARKAMAGETQGVIADAAEKVFGARPEVQIVVGALAEEAPTLAKREEQRKAELRAQREAEARAHPFVQRFLARVGGEIRAVRLDERE
jgi:DNA polymerase-3 subunit gamma/tau